MKILKYIKQIRCVRVEQTNPVHDGAHWSAFINTAIRYGAQQMSGVFLSVEELQTFRKATC